jgi:predicted metal-dependent hydrolase
MATFDLSAVIWRRRAAARRITLRVDAGLGRVVVTLPPRSARAAALALLDANSAWLASQLDALPEIQTLEAGATVSIDGVPRIIRQRTGQQGVWLHENVLNAACEAAVVPRLVGQFLRAEARRRLTGQAIGKSALAGLSLQRVSIRDTRSRWGSCSAAGALMFSWRLVMAPLFVQDYVVAHEVAHLKHLDHGPEFWALADRLSPHREAAVSWLRAEGPRLLRVAWPAGRAPTPPATTG